MLQRYLLIWLVFCSLIALFWQRIAGQDAYDPFVESGEELFWMVAATMFAVGMLLPRDEIREVTKRWPSVLAGTLTQYTVMPLLAFIVAKAFRFEGEMLIGVTLVGCVPGAMASNVLTLNARGNTSYSVSLTTAATLLSPICVPLILGLFLTANEDVDSARLWKASRQLMQNVVLPVIIGQIVIHVVEFKRPTWVEPLRRSADIVAHLAILWIIAVVVGLNRASLSQFPWDVVFALLLINLTGYAAGYGSGIAFRLPEGMRRALTLEVGMQNAGLGAALATSLFANSSLDANRIAIAPAFYTFGCMLTGSILAQLWASAKQTVK